jgi:hypothetical protein
MPAGNQQDLPWTIALLQEAVDVLSSVDPETAKLLNNELRQFMKLWNDFPSATRVIELGKSRFKYKLLTGKSRKHGIHQIYLGKGDDYRAALVPNHSNRTCWNVLIYRKQDQTRAIDRAIAIVQRNEEKLRG